jgi:hypothetical protein
MNLSLESVIRILFYPPVNVCLLRVIMSGTHLDRFADRGKEPAGHWNVSVFTVNRTLVSNILNIELHLGRYVICKEYRPVASSLHHN